MAQNKNELKLNCLNNSVQFSPKLFSPNILLTDYSKNADNENRNNRKIRLIKKNNLNSIINKTNLDDKNKIVVNYNFSKINHNLLNKNSFPDKLKNSGISKNNKSIEKSNKNIKYLNNERNMNNSLNGKIVPYSCHVKEIRDFKPKMKKMKPSESKDQNVTKNINYRKNRNLNLSLTDFVSIGATGYKKSENDIKQIYNLNKSPEILIKRKFINTTKNKLNEKMFGRMNLNNNNNHNDNYSNISNNNNPNNRSVLSNKMTNNSLTYSAAKRNINKSIIFQSNDNVLKINQKYTVIKKFDNIKNNLSQQINEINNNFNKILNITDKDTIKKYQLIFDIIQNSLFKFITLLENPKEKEIGYEIIQKLNEFFKKQDNIISNIIKKNDDLNDKNKKYKDINKNIEKENLQLMDKCDNLEKTIERMEQFNKNELTKVKQYNDTEYNLKIKTNNLFKNNDSLNENEENEDDESSVNTEELESIRFFDKIIMKKHSFSKANIPELEIKQIKLLNDELNNKENIKINNKYKNNNNNNNNKGIRNGLKKIDNKSTKTFGYTKIAVDKKIRNGKQYQK